MSDLKAAAVESSLQQIPTTQLRGVGPALAGKLAALGIHSIQDLLFHLPLRYEDRTRITPMRSLNLGDHVLLQGEVVSSGIQFGRRRSLQVTLSDQSGFVSMRLFHFSAAQKNSLAPGALVRCFGEIRMGRSGFELYHPEYRVLQDVAEPVEASLTPVYPTTDGLAQLRLRGILGQAVALMKRAGIEDLLPPSLCQRYGFASLQDALLELHEPKPSEAADMKLGDQAPGAKRLAFEELLAHRLCLRKNRAEGNRHSAPALKTGAKLSAQFVAGLPFKLTAAQQRVLEEITQDLTTDSPMLRLLQGDVGSGKTVIAALSALRAIDAGYQAALMAPTEILAEQHYNNFCAWFEPLGLSVGWLSGKIKGKARKEVLTNLEAGEYHMMVGTHALFQQGVDFANLGLIVIDEQHRFGVHQRMALRDKGAFEQLLPHQLVMTATPIPRTLAMSAYADLDCSVIDELPPGRIPINTAVIAADRRDQVLQRINEACVAGSQAYWVCTLIEESEELQAQAAEATWEQLGKALPHLNVGLIHGRMKPQDKVAIMDRFKAGEIQLLVATTVIEVGVDVPNANLMVIENPERLGLAQLHQLRGRVGRGQEASYCIMLYRTPLSQLGKERLKVMRESTDGFYIAEKDLELRGPGQVLGTAQTGMMSFRIANLSRDADILDAVQNAADEVLTSEPQLIDPLIKRWLGSREHYVNV